MADLNDAADATTLTPFQYFEALNLSLALIFDEVMAGKVSQDFTPRVESLACDVQNMCRLDADVTLGLMHLDRRDRYTVSHSLHRAIFGIEREHCTFHVGGMLVQKT